MLVSHCLDKHYGTSIWAAHVLPIYENTGTMYAGTTDPMALYTKAQPASITVAFNSVTYPFKTAEVGVPPMVELMNGWSCLMNSANYQWMLLLILLAGRSTRLQLIYKLLRMTLVLEAIVREYPNV